MRIRLESVSKTYKRVRALDNVSLKVEPGQIVAVVGANGAGKTTLLRCLAGVVAASAGAIFYDDEKFHRGRLDLRRRLMFLPDFPFVFGHMDVLHHVAMVLRMYERDGSNAEERVVQLLRGFDLLALAETQLVKLSRGQLYKTTLAALMAAGPELWLVDEPFASGMDPQGIGFFREQARQASSRGTTLVYSTQILDIAEKFSDRVCVLHRGQVRFDGSALGGEKGMLEELFRELRGTAL